MACFYNEKVRRKPMPFAVLLVLFGLSLYAGSAMVKGAGLPMEFAIQLDLMLTLLFLVAGYKAYRAAQDYYKYAIIEGELLIHKMTGDQSQLVERVKLSEVEYLGEATTPVSVLQRIVNNHSASLFRCGHLCVYRQDGMKRHLYFSPSKCLMAKIQSSLHQYQT